MRPFEFRLPTKIVFGRGRITEIGAHIPAAIERVFIVTDGTIASRTPALDTILRSLPGRDVRIFDRVEENPSIATVEEAGGEARAFRAELVIGLGGGSPMDAAKGVALLAADGRPLARFLAGMPVERSPLPVIAVPTTSGTGSEVTPYAVFTDRNAGNKIGYGNDGLFPALALIDPELTYSMPPAVTVNTGLDVLAHAVEAYLSTLSFPLNDALALQAVDVVLAHLGRAALGDRESMDQMSAAAAAAGAAIAHGSTILPHIMGYPLTVFHGVPHGRASAIMLVHVLAGLTAGSACPEKIELINARFVGHGGPEGFLRSLGVSVKLADYGVREENLAAYARKTIVKGDAKITPAAVTVEWIESLYRSAL